MIQAIYRIINKTSSDQSTGNNLSMKRALQDKLSDNYGPRQWKEKPPGPEQLLLDDMFESGSITSDATPDSVRQSTSMFQAFTPKVFGAHFRKTKARLGEFVVSKRIPGIVGGVIPPDARMMEKSGFCQIAELGQNVPPTITNQTSPTKPKAVTEIINPPYKTWIYTDHRLKLDFVCVSINIFTGSKKMTFEITEDGLKVVTKFVWAAAMHDPAKMFHESIARGILSVDHPMIHALSSDYLDAGITEKSTPEGQWIIPLPCKVRREVGSYSMEKLSFDGAVFMFLKLTAYQSDVIIEQANRTMSF